MNVNLRGQTTGLRARGRVYRSLARAFAPPDAVFPVAGPSRWRRDEEYTRLFVAPRPLVYPYESMYSPVPRVMGETTLDVTRWYEAAGFIVPGWHDLPDHVALELAFMAWLAGEERAARCQGEPWRLARTLHFELTFLHDHLIGWIPQFAEAVETSSCLPFYQGMATRLRRWIPWDLDVVSSLAAGLSGEG